MGENDGHRVLIIEDQTILRDTLALALNSEHGFKVVGNFSTAEEGLQFVKSNEVDLAIVDQILPGMNGIELIGLLKSHNSRMRVIICSMYAGAEMILQAYEAGAEGFFPKSEPLDELIRSARMVMTGDTVLPQKIARGFLKYVATLRATPHQAESKELVPQQLKLLQFACQGLSNKEIADRLSLKESNIKSIFNRIYRTLGVTDRASAVFKAIKNGCISLENEIQGLGNNNLT